MMIILWGGFGNGIIVRLIILQAISNITVKDKWTRLLCMVYPPSQALTTLRWRPRRPKLYPETPRVSS